MVLVVIVVVVVVVVVILVIEIVIVTLKSNHVSQIIDQSKKSNNTCNHTYNKRKVNLIDSAATMMIASWRY